MDPSFLIDSHVPPGQVHEHQHLFALHQLVLVDFHLSSIEQFQSHLESWVSLFVTANQKTGIQYIQFSERILAY